MNLFLLNGIVHFVSVGTFVVALLLNYIFFMVNNLLNLISYQMIWQNKLSPDTWSTPVVHFDVLAASTESCSSFSVLR